MERFKKIAALIAAQKKRLATLVVGWSADKISNCSFEYILYPAVIGYWGLLKGGAFMISLSVILSLLEIKLYDFLKIDWLGIEAVKGIRDGEAKSIWERITQWVMKKGDIFALVVLSIYSEPVKVTLYMRRGSNKFNGFSRRDRIVFITSVLIGNISWAVVVAGGWKIFRWLT